MTERSIMIRAAVLIGLVALLSSCATATTARQAPAVDVTGTWSGTWRLGGDVGDVTLSLKQVGSDVTGMAVVPGWAPFNGPVTGTVEANIFNYTVGAGGAELTVTGDQMSGYGRGAGARLALRRQR